MQEIGRRELPENWKIHPVFNISLLEKCRGSNPEREVVEIEADDSGWKMESLIASGPSNHDHKKQLDKNNTMLINDTSWINNSIKNNTMLINDTSLINNSKNQCVVNER